MSCRTERIVIEAGGVTLEGQLAIPRGSRALVAFVHGSGSSQFSPRNRYVADVLNGGNLATLLFDLLTEEEQVLDERSRELRFNIPLLSQRLVDTLDWLAAEARTAPLSAGLFGASTGAAAALVAAARRPQQVHAVVCRGGRPDLALKDIARVTAPTLLIVGGLDGPVIDMNRHAATAMRCEHELRIVPGASHLFEEPGKLHLVAELARHWFSMHLATAPSVSRNR